MMIIKKITMSLYFLLVISTFLYVAQQNDFDIGAGEIFFGILFPCFIYWLIHNWLSKGDKDLIGTQSKWVNHFFYFLCFIAGVIVLVKIVIDPSIAAMAFILLPFIQGLIYLVGVAVIAHFFIFTKPHNQGVK